MPVSEDLIALDPFELVLLAHVIGLSFGMSMHARSIYDVF